MVLDILWVLCMFTINCGKFWKRWEYQITWPASWETCTQVRKQQLELDIGTTDWFQTGKGVPQGWTGRPGVLWFMGSQRVGQDWATELNCTCLAAKLCLTLWDPVDYSPPRSSVHEISQARILEWVAISSSKNSASLSKLFSFSEAQFPCLRRRTAQMLSNGPVIFLSDQAVCVCVLSCFSHVWLFVIPWTVAHQAPLSLGFSRQEYWSGLSLPPLGDLPIPGIKPSSLMSPTLVGRFFTASAT